MKALAYFLLSLSLTGQPSAPAPRLQVDKAIPQVLHRKGGRWYFAENGHAVYCYGPVRLLPQPEGGLRRVATFCQGSKLIVPLRD